MEDRYLSDGLRGLYQDLSSLSSQPLQNVDRLCLELETQIEDFKRLLDKPTKNNASRQAVLSGKSTCTNFLKSGCSLPLLQVCCADLFGCGLGKITIAQVEYAINEDFKEGTLQLADALDLDELEAASLYMVAQEDAQQLDRPPLITAIMSFHKRRGFLLECLRLIFQESLEVERDATQPIMQETLAYILDIKAGPLRNASKFTRKCMDSLVDIEKWLLLLGEQVQKASIVGQDEDPDVLEAIDFQRTSLEQQHESLGAILCYLFKGPYTSHDDLRHFLGHMRKLDRFDALLVHYIPAVVASFVQHGSPEGSSSHKEARSLHPIITASRESQSWALANFHAAVTVFWLAVYSGWYFEAGPSSPAADLEKEAEERTNMFSSALDDGGLDFILAICSGVNNEEWRDPARSELVALLLKESATLTIEPGACSLHMKRLLMESFESFTESCVANMPDAVRMLKSEEDLQRLDHLTALRDGLTSNLHRSLVEARTHLESFLIIIAFAFEGRQDAAQEFWADHDSNLYGFLQWASKRQTVPRVSAFCEVLCSISEGEENANSAHRFLSEEDKFISSRFRRSTSMNWTQMFAELKLYALKVTEKPVISQGVLHVRKSEPSEMIEPESPVMLSCYLRLMGHLCRQSVTVRNWMLHHPTFNLVGTLLTLCSGLIPTHLRATAFTCLTALMQERTSQHGHEMWLSIDQWISGGAMSAAGLTKVPIVSNPPVWHEQQALQKIGESFDQTNAFVDLIHTLVSPAIDSVSPSLPFPESLGATYRNPGIDPYVDFVLGQGLCRKSLDLSEHQARLLTYNCLNFVVTCLRSFNENFVTVFSQPSGPSSKSIFKPAGLPIYVRLHPFARIAEWLFNEEVIKAIFAAAHQEVSEVARASADSILVLSLLRSIQVIDLFMDLQSTYSNIVRPLIKSSASSGRNNVANSALAFFEDSILTNLDIVPRLCLYCGTGHEQLTLVSVTLLEKLSSSRRLNRMTPLDLSKWQSSNKIVEALSTEVEVDRVSRPLISQMQPDLRELELGSESAGYVIRQSILELLNSCLSTIRDRPNVAHLLLGFTYVGNTLNVSQDGLFANRMSLLHAIIEFLQNYPDQMEDNILLLMVRLKRMALEVLRHLWSSKLSSYFALSEMRANRFLFTSISSQPIVGPNSLWDGFSIMDEQFWVSPSAAGLAEFLLYRSHLYDYAATEIRAAAKLGSPTLQSQILSTLFGSTALETGETILNPTIFDLFDFADLDVRRQFFMPELTFLNNLEIDLCARPQADGSLILYNINEAEGLIEVRRGSLQGAGQLRPQDEESFEAESIKVKAFLVAVNNSRTVNLNRFLALRSWAELITTVVTCSDLDGGRRSTFILHSIQLILPKLEVAIAEDSLEAIELARLAETLANKLGPASKAPSSQSGDVIYEKLYQLFQICIRGVVVATANTGLRETLYNICSYYVARITSSPDAHESTRLHSQQAIKTGGPPLIETICDDAYTGQETCRVSALLLLNLLAVLDRHDESILAELISQSNYLNLFLEAVRTLPVELRNAQASGKLSSCAPSPAVANRKPF